MRNDIQEVGNEGAGDPEWKRRLRLLSEIARKGFVSIEELERTFHVPEKIIQSDIELMKSMSIPVQPTPTDVSFSRGRPPDAAVYKRRLRLAADVFQGRFAPIREFEQSFNITRETVDADVGKLRALGIPLELVDDNVVLPPIGVEDLWRDTVVGERLRNAHSMNRKQYLAESVVAYLKAQGYSIRSVLIGTGVSAYKVAEAIYVHAHELHIQEVHSSSVLVLFAFAFFRPHDITLRLAGGQLDRTTAWLEGESGIKHLQGQPVDAIVTSFMCFSMKGFTTQQPYEVGEKRMNLLHRNARFCLIPMEWTKLAGESGNLIAPDGGTGEDVLDFLDGRRTYVIFTDVPETPRDDKDKERFDVLDYWEQEKDVKVIRLPRPDETSATK